MTEISSRLRQHTPHRLALLLSVLLAAPLAAQHAGHGASEPRPANAPRVAVATGDLGHVVFPNSGAPEAQEAFLRGVLFLHSFEYDDARDAFREAQEIDPDFVLAYWGEAMTHNYPLWRSQAIDEAREVLARLAPTREERAAKATTERERGFLEAVEILYGEGSKAARDLAYSQAMERLAAAHPEDDEAAAFYALSILGTAQERDFGIYMRAAAVVEEVFDRNPRHPGAVHYLIHSYDDPVHAPLGLRPARVYATIAPAASHAQHMISHIYIALGRWDEAAVANEKSVAVSVERLERLGLPTHQRNHHSLHWLEYSYLQQGRFDEAWETVTLMDADAVASERGGDRTYQVAMRATYGAETGDWQRAAEVEVDTAGREISAVALRHYTVGRAALERDDAAAARAELAALAAARKVAEAEARPDDPTARDSPADHAAAHVLELQLAAEIALAAGDEAEALRLFGEATAAESAMALDYGPPLVVKPSHERLGEVLLAAGRAPEARVAFERGLERAPRRALALAGLAAAARAAGDAEAADRAAAELATVRVEARAASPTATRR